MEAALVRAGKEGRGVAELIEDAVRSYLDAVGERNLGEEAAAKLAEEAVRRARSEAPERSEESPAPSPEEVRARRERLRRERAKAYSAARGSERKPGSS